MHHISESEQMFLYPLKMNMVEVVIEEIKRTII